MQYKPKLLIVIALWSMSLIACQRETAFEPGRCYSVQQLLNSQEAKVACDEIASFEGRTLCLIGALEVSNDPRPIPGNFFLQNPVNPYQAVEVQLEEELGIKIIPQVQANRGRAARIIGTMGGFGHTGSPDCKRTFILTLANLDDFKLKDI